MAKICKTILKMMRAESVDNRFVSYFQRLEKDV